MFIFNSGRTCIHNSDFILRYVISQKDDGWIVHASYSANEPMMKLGRYSTEAQARDVLNQIFLALHGGACYFEMPASADMKEQETIKDARVKRKGGS